MEEEPNPKPPAIVETVGSAQDAPALDWQNAICEACWMSREPYTQRRDRHTTVNIPSTLEDRDVDVLRCGYCGNPTIWGQYVHVDPATLEYPNYKDSVPLYDFGPPPQMITYKRRRT